MIRVCKIGSTPSFIGQKVCLDESCKMTVASQDCISGLHNGLKFSQLLLRLDEAMQIWKKSSISYIVNIA